MQIALRPVAVRALLLIAGVVLGLVAFLAVFAATTSSHIGHTASASATAGDSHDQILAGVHWN